MSGDTGSPLSPRASGAGLVVVAQVINGVAAYLFLIVAGRTLGDHRFAPLSILWAAQFLVGSGVFISFEQELARTVSSGTRNLRNLSSNLRSARVVFFRYLAVVIFMAAVSSAWITHRFLDGEPMVYVGLVMGIVGFAFTHAVRGVLAGLGWFKLYALWFVLDAAIRVGVTLALVASGVRTAGPYALAAGGASLCAIAVVTYLTTRKVSTDSGPASRDAATTSEEAPASDDSSAAPFAGAVAALTVAALLMAILVNGGPIAVQWFAGTAEQSRTSVFLTGLVLTRTPLLLFQTVQSALIPMLAAYVTRSDFEGLRKRVAVMSAGVIFVATVGVAVAGVAGRFFVIRLFGESFGRLSGVDLALQAAAAFLLVLAMVFALALIATRQQRLVPIAWAAGVLAFFVVLLVSGELFIRVERALVVSATVAAVTMAVMAFSAMRSRRDNTLSAKIGT